LCVLSVSLSNNTYFQTVTARLFYFISQTPIDANAIVS